ncbi:unnamed protein product, partial [Iphiclides podalirius]
MATEGRTKRSQSICAPASASMEALAAPMETTPAPRRRPATRSQSARITGGRSVRHRRQQQLDKETRARYSSEPRLAEAETPPQVRRQASARRRPPPGQQPRRSNAFLDVPRTTHQPEEEPDEDSYRLRTFNTTHKGGQCLVRSPSRLKLNARLRFVFSVVWQSTRRRPASADPLSKGELRESRSGGELTRAP